MLNLLLLQFYGYRKMNLNTRQKNLLKKLKMLLIFWYTLSYRIQILFKKDLFDPSIWYVGMLGPLWCSYLSGAPPNARVRRKAFSLWVRSTFLQQPVAELWFSDTRNIRRQTFKLSVSGPTHFFSHNPLVFKGKIALKKSFIRGIYMSYQNYSIDT